MIPFERVRIMFSIHLVYVILPISKFTFIHLSKPYRALFSLYLKSKVVSLSKVRATIMQAPVRRGDGPGFETAVKDLDADR